MVVAVVVVVTALVVTVTAVDLAVVAVAVAAVAAVAADRREVSDSLCKCLVLNEGVHCDCGIEWEAGPRGA